MSDKPPGMFDVSATRVIDADRRDVFAFLADLENHWLIADRFVDVLDLEGPPGGRTGGRLRVRGPLGVRRTARTRVDFAHPVEEMGGSADLGTGTSAEVRWVLQRDDRGTAITLGANIRRAGLRDRVLLGLGGMAWMQRRFNGTLRALENHLTRAGTNMVDDPAPAT